jgi:hypothetical protein
MATVPADWEMLMLGGQCTKPPVPAGPGVVRVSGCQRSHAYAVSGAFLRPLHLKLREALGHADACLREIQRGRRVFAPDPFLVGQRTGWSDLAGAAYGEQFWNGSKMLPDPLKELGLACQPSFGHNVAPDDVP